MDTFEAKLAVQETCKLAEGPLWWHKAWWWIDIDNGRIHCWEPNSGERALCEIGEPVGFIVPIKDTKSEFIAGLKSGFARIDFNTGKVTPIADPEADKPENRFNDGKADPQGRVYGGTLSPESGGGGFYRLFPNGEVEQLWDGVTISNGLAWNEGAGEFYYIDTPTRRIEAFEYNFETGEIGPKRRSLETDPSWGHPDGMSIDVEGGLWVSFFAGRAVRRIDPVNGECTAIIELPVPRVTCCAFGGPEQDQLFITTARSEEPDSGSLFLANPGIKGASTYPAILD